MKISIIILSILFLTACGSDSSTTSGNKKAESRYSETLKHSRETAGQLEQSLSDSARRSSDLLQKGDE